ncbi:hypothetical protein SEA_MARIETTA_67 [Gordonia phage Marietta]|uniref:Uncharacterized protein n=1 Tax=Gordonia phage Marietta TaxID=2301558 RepID=A0A385DPS1_9CAUD|nr:hypothetical protein KNU07_gp67 [Gordonia phage Marietta]AXQ61386.1 hypothetical protein SEA_MARIETTA_67 [Gordonia phage Marietta]
MTEDFTEKAEQMFAQAVNLQTVLDLLAGAASVCWAPRPTGNFLPDETQAIVDAAKARIEELMK